MLVILELDQSINTRGQNKVLYDLPPEIHYSEKTLPRKPRSILSQLRSGYSTILNFYLSRIDEYIQNNYPDCQLSLNDKNHMFSCQEKSSTLTTRCLWEAPIEAAVFWDYQKRKESNALLGCSVHQQRPGFRSQIHIILPNPDPRSLPGRRSG